MNTDAKKRRGRPALLDPKDMGMYAGLFQGVGCKLSLQNKYYLSRAVRILADGNDVGPDERFKWIWTPHKCKQTILSALGRIDDEETLRQAALLVCEKRMRTRDAVAAVKRLRGANRAKAASALELAARIGQAIDDYQTNHPGLTPEQVQRALEIISEAEDSETA